MFKSDARLTNFEENEQEWRKIILLLCQQDRAKSQEMNVPIKSKKVKITASHDLYKIMREVLLRENKYRRRQEYFWVMGLTTGLRLEYIELVALGRVNAVNAEPTEIFSIAIQKRCKKIVLVHNHPGGSNEPSKDDIRFTKATLAASKIVKIEILDHLIITETDYYSFDDNGEL